MKCTVQTPRIGWARFSCSFSALQATAVRSASRWLQQASPGFALAKRNLKRIDGDELVELVYKYYPQLDARYKAMIPLPSVCIPETLAE